MFYGYIEQKPEEGPKNN